MAAVFAAAPAVAQDFTGTTVTISGTATVAETDSDQTITYTITRTGAEFTQTANSLISFVDANSVDISKTGTATSLGVSPSVFTATSADYSLVGNNLISFAPGEDSKQFSITIVGDDLSEEDESFAISISFSNIGDSFLVTITDDDAVRTLTVTGPASIDENAGGTFTVNLVGTAFTSPTAVTWTVTHGDTVAADFTAVTGSVNFGIGDTSQTFAITPADDDLDEDAESFTVQITVADEGADGGTAFGDAASSSIADNDMAGVVIAPAMLEAPEGGEAEYSVRLTAEPTATVTVAISSSADTVATPMPATLTFTAANWRAGETVTVTAADAAEVDDSATLTHTVTGSGEYASVTAGDVTVTITEPDDPAARAARVKTPLAAIAGGVGQLTAQAVSQRLRFTGADAFHLGAGATAEDLPRQGAFALAHANGGINLWGSGARISAKGDDNGVTYDGDATALHLGADTAWRDGLVGIALAQSTGDADFAAGGIGSTLKTSIVSAHPYLTRTRNNTKLWATIGYGTGEAELRETEDANRRRTDTDITLLSAAAGAALAVGDNAFFHFGGNWSRAELAAATLADEADADRTYALPATSASVLRLTGGAELSRRFGDWRPFVTVNLRRDSGDGDDGNAADYGGGVEWQNNNIHLRLAGRKHAQGRGPDEEHLTLTARKTAGRLNLGLNLSAANGINTANLLTGELRF